MRWTMDTEAAVRAIASVRELPEWLTPLRALASVEDAPDTVFFESGGEGGESADWTILAFDPAWRLELRDGALVRYENGRARRLDGHPLEALRSAWPERAEVLGAPPAPFLSGLAGYLGYDFKDWIERYPDRALREWTLPDLSLGFYDVVWAWRRSTGEGWAVSSGLGARDERGLEDRARVRLEEQWQRIEGGAAGGSSAARVAGAGLAASGPSCAAPTVRSNFTREAYCRMVETALEHIAAGDVYQVNLAQRFLVQSAPPPAAVFRALREAAPAPFLAFVALDEAGIASSSPERFFRIQGRRIETWPVKGTRPRGKTPEEDDALRAELIASAKDRAENVMIVDLERNDLGRVCEVGSVRVPALCEVTSHSKDRKSVV